MYIINDNDKTIITEITAITVITLTSFSDTPIPLFYRTGRVQVVAFQYLPILIVSTSQGYDTILNYIVFFTEVLFL